MSGFIYLERERNNDMAGVAAAARRRCDVTAVCGPEAPRRAGLEYEYIHE